MRAGVTLLFCLFLIATSATCDAIVDGDRDGLSDQFEQSILEKFQPEYRLSGEECAGKPAEFEADSASPRAIAANGTIYGQVFPLDPDGGHARLEAHFYSLWESDCGRISHSLDAEHVSVLLAASSIDAPANEWKALYWYAAAHETTPCDASNAGRGDAVGAESKGATFWISRGKHAAFLDPRLCRFGCGADSCDGSVSLQVAGIINIGEPGEVLNGAAWVNSKRWPLRRKMDSDFSASTLSKLRQLDSVKAEEIRDPVPPTKAVILAGNSAFTGLQAGASGIQSALDASGSRTAHSFKNALLATVKFLGLKSK